MFPGVSGFHWDIGHVIFLGAFFSVVILIAITIIMAMLRAARDQAAPGREQAIRWHVNFSELPSADRRCRHELTGEVRSRQCPNELDCRNCREHPKFVQAHAGPMAEVDLHQVVCGMPVPLDRLYHRGHTWAKAEPDGTFTVGLDEFGTRLAGHPDQLEMPSPGTPVFVNGTAWKMRANGDSVRILSPVSGSVIATAHGENGWYLKIQPEKNFRTDHLLKGAEVSAWMSKEIERLQLALGSGPEPALADGGTLVADLAGEYPDADWSDARARMFLNG